MSETSNNTIKHWAFVFPGQGSQSVGMLANLAEETIVRHTFEEASDALDYDMAQLIASGPAETLNQTDKTQPALLAASTALWRLWCDNAPQPEQLAGHSLGEYSALVAAGVIPFVDAIKLVEKRGLFMQQAVPAGTGKMAAIIGLADELVSEACIKAQQNSVVSAVNFNSPGQVVIAGQADAVERAMGLCKEKGAKRALPLPVSVPSHCALMKPAALQLENELAKLNFAQPKIKVVNNVDVAVVSDESEIKDALIRQLYSPVRWTESITCLAANGVTDLAECGPGAVLSGLCKRIDRTLSAHKLSSKDAFNQVVGAVC